MSDNDQTILSKSGSAAAFGEPEMLQRNRQFLFGGIGCAVLLCAGLLLGGYFFRNQLFRTGGAEEVAATVEVASPTVELPTDTPTSELPAAAQPTSEPTLEATEESMTGTPEIGPIVFARDATDDYEPVDPGIEFEGEVTEIHAIFDYSGLTSADIWERVWFLDGIEMLRTAEPWTAAEEGVFDYFINAGGEPLAPGEWLLELYVNNHLMATGSFRILEGEEPIAQTDSGPVEPTDEPVGTAEPEPTLEVDGDGDAQPEAAVTAAVQPPAVNVEPGTAEASPIVSVATLELTPVPESQTYRLAYTKWNGVQHNLFVGDTSGSSEQFIVGLAQGPSWAPDGSAIYFYGASGIDRQEVGGAVYTFPAISDGVAAVTTDPLPNNMGEVRLLQRLDWKDANGRSTAVSPSGEIVAFDSRRSGNYRIYFLGTGENQQLPFEIIGEQPAWAPDSQRLVYRSGRDGRTGIWISNRNDSGHTLITDGSNDAFPNWSPDGQTIAFSRDESGNVDIFTVNVDGSNLQRLTNAPGPDTLPVFSPDGDIIFRSSRTGVWSIWKMKGDGSSQTEIIPGTPVGPDWTASKMSILGS